MRKLLLLLSALAALQTPAPAAPLDRKDVPDEAAWVMHADIAAVRNSGLGGYIDSVLRRPDMQRQINGFQTAYGFDPRRDLTGVTAYGLEPADPQGAPNGIAIFRGTFDPARMKTVTAGLQGYEETAHGGSRILSWKDAASGGQRQYGCAHASGAVLLGARLNEMRTALDVLEGRRASLGPKSALQKLITPAPGVLALGAVARIRAGKGGFEHPVLAAASSARTGTFGVREKDGNVLLDSYLRMEDATAAQQLADLFRGYLALSALSTQDPLAAEAARAAVVTQDGPMCGLRMRVPSAQLVAWLSSQQALLGPLGAP